MEKSASRQFKEVGSSVGNEELIDVSDGGLDIIAVGHDLEGLLEGG